MTLATNHAFPNGYGRIMRNHAATSASTAIWNKAWKKMTLQSPSGVAERLSELSFLTEKRIWKPQRFIICSTLGWSKNVHSSCGEQYTRRIDSNVKLA